MVRGEHCQTKTKGEDTYRMRFEVTEGTHVGKTVIRTWTFGEDAAVHETRLGALRADDRAKLLSPFPEAGREYFVRLVVGCSAATTASTGTT